MSLSPFDHQRDEELGRLLREQLTGPRPEAFLLRLRLAVAGAPAARRGQWDLLEQWARPRVLALAIAAGLLLWLGAWFSTSRTAVEPGVMVASLPAHSVVNPQPPRTDEIMGALLEGPAR
jgi:hypothetical protein